MSEKRPDTGFQCQLIDMNKEFLRLLTDPANMATNNLFGLAPEVLAGLRKFSASQLDRVAAVPILLTEFEPLPGLPEFSSVADTPALPVGVSPAWQREAEAFANRLLACIWQSARQDHLLTAFCIGIDPDRHRRIAESSFASISQSSERTLRCLRVRLGSHPTFWNDLLLSILHGTDDQQVASRLAMIPLSVAHAGLPTTTADRPRYF